MTLILRSKSSEDRPVSVGDLTQVCIKHEKKKRGSWTSPKPVLKFDAISNNVYIQEAELYEQQSKMPGLQ